MAPGLIFVRAVRISIRWSGNKFKNNRINTTKARIFMSWLAYLVVGAAGTALLSSGLYYHFNFRKLKADPVLIGGCYVFGGALVASCII
jgi:hypothetical protein